MSAAQNSPKHGTTLAQDFRNWLATLPKEDLHAVLSNRLDTAVPVPPDITALSTRMMLPGSLARALATCTAAELAVIETLAQLGAEMAPVSDDALAQAMPFAPADASLALSRKALIFQAPLDDNSDANGPEPKTGWCLLPRIMQALPSDLMLLHQPDVTVDEVRALDKDKREVLATIARAGGSIVTVGTHSTMAASDALQELLEMGLLIEDGSRMIRLPRTVLQAMKGHTPVVVPLEAPVALTTSSSTASNVDEQETKADQSGTATGLDVVYAMDRVIESLSRKPQALLKNKALGIRQVTSIAQEIGREESEAQALLALGMSSRLLGRGEPEGHEGNFLAPTPLAIQWLDAPLSERWQALLEGWERMDTAWWSSQRGIDPESTNARLPELRAMVTHTFNAAAQALDDELFNKLFSYLHPLAATHTHGETITQLRQEAQWIGAVSHGRATAVIRDSFAAAEELCPEPIEQFIIQADHTVMAPGPLTPELQKILSSFATLESPGLASVYRFDHDSIRRGLDSSLTASEMKNFLQAHTWGEVPQAITVLIDDVARSHGTLRSSAISCYVRSDDEALLAQSVAAVPELRSIAPTVAVSHLPLATILQQLRDAGFSPVAEDDSGVSIDVRPEPALVPAAKPSRVRHTTQGEVGEDHVERAVAHLISQTNAKGAAPSTEPNTETNANAEDYTALLRAAVRGSHQVKITYANKHGEPTSVSATPLRVDAGQVDALVGTKTVRFPLHRISTVVMD
ncbi:helicase-associated domain-containing protein [Corynebacterium sp. L4756]|uniref:helicase-associated domain-containing protein n=1 Tax=unclassified Corynebacterium TaxID=2624378 RepID=UPI00374D7C03